MNQQDQEYELYEHCETVSTIHCTTFKCKNRSTHHQIDPMEAGALWYQEGWRATKHQNVYCPACAKKKLKNP